MAERHHDATRNALYVQTYKDTLCNFHQYRFGYDCINMSKGEEVRLQIEEDTTNSVSKPSGLRFISGLILLFTFLWLPLLPKLFSSQNQRIELSNILPDLALFWSKHTISCTALGSFIDCDVNSKSRLQSKKCPQDWIDLGENGCFHFSSEVIRNYDDARQYCQNLDGFLAEIKEAKTNELIVSQADKYEDSHWWLGATDVQNEGIWIWEKSGEKMEFANWNVNEPNGGRRENYLHMTCAHCWGNGRYRNRTWNDAPNYFSDQKVKPLCQLY